MSRLWGTPVLSIPVDPSSEDEPSVAADREAVRLSIAAGEYPRTLLLVGCLLLVFTALTYLAGPTDDFGQHNYSIHVIDVAVAAVILVTAYLMRRGTIPVRRRPALYSAVLTLFGLALLYEVVLEQTPLSYAYAVILMCSFGPSTLAWRPFLIASAVLLAGAVAVAATWSVGHTLDWILVAVAAILVSCLALTVRMRSIYALADATALARRLATMDQLTGVLNRHGLMARVPALWAQAERLDESVFVVFVDIRGLKQANDRYGHEFGDRAIQTAARAVVKSVRGGDLVARWGGDEIVVLGLGRLPDAEAFDQRLQSQHEWTGEDEGKWAGGLSVGFADGLPQTDSVDDLIRRADAEMYRRRLSH